MAILRVCVLLVLATALAVQAAKVSPTSGLFLDWLDSTTKAKSQDYEPVEVEHACLRQTSLINCLDFLPDDAPSKMWYLEYKLACCGSDSYSDEGNFLMDSMREAGMCNDVRTNWFDNPIQYPGTNVEKIGKFHVTCTFGEESGKCGGPLCNGLTFTAWGDMLRKPDVVFIGKPAAPYLDSNCTDVILGGPPGDSKKASRSASPVDSLKATPSGGYDGEQLYQGQGDIQTGFFTVTSPHQKVHVKTGHFQLTYSSGNYTHIDKMPTDANWVAVSSDIKLSFYKSESY